MPRSVLLVDDEDNILKALGRVLSGPEFSLLTATSAEEALERLEGGSVAVAIVDYRLPGADGIQLLETIRERSPDTIRILMTGIADVKVAMAGINRGDIYRFIQKPWNNDELVAAVRSALAEYELRQENRRLRETIEIQNEELRKLNETLEKKYEAAAAEVMEERSSLEEASEKVRRLTRELVRSMGDLMRLRSKRLGEHCRAVGALCKEVAKDMRLPEEEIMQVEIAGLLHDIGKVGLRDAVLAKPTGLLTKQEAAEVSHHPIIGQAICEHAEVLRSAATLIRAHHERYDGMGFPDRVSADEIPLGARIIRVCDAYDHLSRSDQFRRSTGDALGHLERSGGSEFDPAVLLHLGSVLRQMSRRAGSPKAKAREVTIGLLRPGMVAYADVKTSRGALLVSRGEIFTEEVIQRLHHYDRLDPVVQPILVYN